jgi:hypothetical protein
MAYLRACYTTKARFFKDDNRQDTIKWYWADANAPRFSTRHAFAPLSFQVPALWVDKHVGEVESASRPWWTGSKPGLAASGNVDGPAQWFHSGQSIKDPGLDRTDFGVPTACQPVLEICRGEEVLWHYWYAATPGNDAMWIGFYTAGGPIQFNWLTGDHTFVGLMTCDPAAPAWAINNLRFDYWTEIGNHYYYAWREGPVAGSFQMSDREFPLYGKWDFDVWQRPAAEKGSNHEETPTNPLNPAKIRLLT